MYRLTIFILISCTISEQLVGAAKGRASPIEKALYLTPLDQEPVEEPEDALRKESVSYTNASSVNGDVESSSGSSYLKRNVLVHLLTSIESFLGISHDTTTVPSEPILPIGMDFTYRMDESLGLIQSIKVESLLLNITKNTCANITETEESPDVIFTGDPGCGFQVIDNNIVIGQECFDPTIVAKLMFEVLKICDKVTPAKRSLDGNRAKGNKLKEGEKEVGTSIECVDKANNCNFWSKDNRCSKLPQILAPICPRSCRVCGDSECVDYDSNCQADDVVLECLKDWDRKRYTCAKTCGMCEKSKYVERARVRYCNDRLTECSWLAKRGYCEKFPERMEEVCPKSCGYCKERKYRNKRGDCSSLVALGACRKILGLMKENCPEMCGCCEDSAEPSETPPSDNNLNALEECKVNRDYILNHCTWEDKLNHQ